ncbi:unnamed protein product [Clonostachys byssicola]|uniref:Shikimate dehydrogenase substrate binding N-terminal domain-containing protein n=1 Tax=Clonostachys byssicola TaxID=160290 RepID=A0A9N9UIX4_9HYPO|nr:unnamed protein product [Clonostachys byssicola]
MAWEYVHHFPYEQTVYTSISMDQKAEKHILFVGTNLSHAVSNRIHDIVAKEVGINWQLEAMDTPVLDKFAKRIRDEDFGGAIVTIPHKINVLPLLDHIDPMAQLLGACNNVYRRADGLLAGTNTDWIGVRDSLLDLSQRVPGDQLATDSTEPGRGKPAFVVGAGGAARAAVYALSKALGATVIYVINRDEHEVAALIHDAQNGYRKAGLEPPIIKHLRKPSDAIGLEDAYYGIGTVPDFEPCTETELDARAVFIEILNRQRGVFLDMCYRPRFTRNLKLAREKGWTSGDGGQVVGWQLKAQWEVWAGKDISDAIPLSKMIEQVHEIVESLAH